MKIVEVKADITGGGMACGPVPGYVTAEAKVLDNGRVFYAGILEVEGMMNYYESDTSLHEMIVSDEYEDTDFIDWGCEYEEYEENPNEDPDKDALIRYLIYVVRTDWDTCNAFIEKTMGRDLSELDIPRYADDDEWDDEE